MQNNIQEEAIIMKEKEKINLQKSINNRDLCRVRYISPVSYTHLDVYKRQRYGSVLFYCNHILCFLYNLKDFRFWTS